MRAVTEIFEQALESGHRVGCRVPDPQHRDPRLRGMPSSEPRLRYTSRLREKMHIIYMLSFVPVIYNQEPR